LFVFHSFRNYFYALWIVRDDIFAINQQHELYRKWNKKINLHHFALDVTMV